MFRVLLGVSYDCRIMVNTAEAELFLRRELALLGSSTLSNFGGPSTYYTLGRRNSKLINLFKLKDKSAKKSSLYIALAVYTSFSLSYLHTLRWKSLLLGKISSSAVLADSTNFEDVRS